MSWRAIFDRNSVAFLPNTFLVIDQDFTNQVLRAFLTEMQSPALKPLGEAEPSAKPRTDPGQPVLPQNPNQGQTERSNRRLEEVLQQYVGPTHMTGVST